jgi:hypothetical protein
MSTTNRHRRGEIITLEFHGGKKLIAMTTVIAVGILETECSEGLR